MYFVPLPFLPLLNLRVKDEASVTCTVSLSVIDRTAAD